MTVVFYNLEEAAEQLKFSETVLVRLSQYFKVPQVAYEQSGYLSFKGDLAFSEQDLAFFARIKERLVLGESLDAIKEELSQFPHTQWVAYLTGRPEAGIPVAVAQPPHESEGLTPEVLGGVSQMVPGELPPMREIQGRQPYEKVAAQSFERYKSMHRNSLGKVFENMLKEVSSASVESRPASVLPGFRPVRPKSGGGVSAPKSGKELQREALLPFHQADQPAPYGRGGLHATELTGQPLNKTRGSVATPATDAVWQDMIQQATHTPRSLDSSLKNAAQLLRARTLGQPVPSSHSLR